MATMTPMRRSFIVRTLRFLMILAVFTSIGQVGGLSSALVDVFVEESGAQCDCPSETERDGTQCPSNCAVCNAHGAFQALPPTLAFALPAQRARELPNVVWPYRAPSPRSLDRVSLYRPPRT